MSSTRRTFLAASTAAAGGVAFTAGPLAARAARILGSSDDLRVAVVGVRSRGWNHVQGFEELDGVRVVALCDADRAQLERRAADFEKRWGRRPELVVDVRELLERDDVDVVSIATPNHWHALMAIWACQAGKDVYVEKPVSHNVWEGRQLVKAAEQYGRIVQCGTQSRSNPGLHAAVDFAHSGEIGALQLARGLCYKPRPSIGKVDQPTAIPDSVDYDLWCGPADAGELRRRQLHYDWHWVWATGNGDLGNQGIHQMDMCRMALREPQLAPRVWSVGGRLGYDDDGETPNTMISLFEYARAPLIFEVRGLPRARGDKQMDRFLGASIGCVLHCEGGWVSITNYAGGSAFDRDGKEIAKFSGSGNHFANFVEAVRARDPKRLNGPILDGHLSSALCHQGNVSLRVGAEAGADAVGNRLQNQLEFAESWWRMRDHLARNDVDLDVSPVTLGARLDFDPETERFVGEGDAVTAANRLVRGTYRAPFTVPEKV